ncbi:MAG: polyprenyl synthetase family protein [Actinocatenispora sp.]
MTSELREPVGPATLDAAPPRQRGTTDVAWRVTRVLGDVLTAEADTVRALDPELGAAVVPLRDLVLRGGKRLRPAFGYWGYRGLAAASAPAVDDAVLRAVSALELLHVFAMVHDDVMDAAGERRGRPTLQRIFADRHDSAGWRGDPTRFGTSAAVLLGDLCAVWADRLIADCGLPAPVILSARRVYDVMRIEAMAGQYLDVLGEATGPSAGGPAAALKVARFKSASYTVQRPLRFGAALSGRPDADVTAAYDRFGFAVGEAFQLRDDLLGVYGDRLVTGKPVGDDLRRGAPTVLVSLARSRATESQRRVLDMVLGDPAASADAIAEVAGLITDTGARAEVEGMISDRVGTALAALAAAPIHEVARGELSRLAVAAVQRSA